MAERIARHDWASTSLGPIERWPRSLRTAVRIMLDSRYPMFVWWGEHYVTLYNDAYAVVLGDKHPAALGAPGPVVWREIWNDVGSRAESVLRGGAATYDEGLLLMLERHGYVEETYFTFSYSPAPDDDGGVGGVFCVCQDVTRQALGERRMKLLHGLSTATAEARSEGDACAGTARSLETHWRDLPFALIYLLEDDGQRLLRCGVAGLPEDDPRWPEKMSLDDAAARGWRIDEAARGPGMQFVDDLPPLPVKRDGPPRRAAVMALTRPGDERGVGVLVAGLTPHRPFDEDFRHFVELLSGQVATAVTNVRVYAEERRRAEALAQLDKDKDRFLAMLSHELRTPLTPVLVATQLMENHPELAAGLRDHLAMIRRNVQLEARLIDDLLDVARVTKGKLVLNREPVDAHQKLNEVLRACATEIEAKRIAIHTELHAPRPVVNADPARLQQVIWNLVRNAVKFTESEGSVTVRTRAGGDGELMIEVRDTGMGIDPQLLPRLFNAFEQGGNDTTRRFGGLGLGLAITRAIVDAHGGAIGAASEGVGRGATFTVTLPLADGAPAAPRGHDGDGDGVARPRSAERPCRILLVEDHEDTARLMTQILAAGGYTVSTAGTVQEALRLAGREAFDVVVSDLGLPDGSGIDLLRRLTEHGPVPAIALSGYAMENDVAESRRAGFRAHLTKPVDVDHLHRVLQDVLRNDAGGPA